MALRLDQKWPRLLLPIAQELTYQSDHRTFAQADLPVSQIRTQIKPRETDESVQVCVSVSLCVYVCVSTPCIWASKCSQVADMSVNMFVAVVGWVLTSIATLFTAMVLPSGRRGRVSRSGETPPRKLRDLATETLQAECCRENTLRNPEIGDLCQLSLCAPAPHAQVTCCHGIRPNSSAKRWLCWQQSAGS